MGSSKVENRSADLAHSVRTDRASALEELFSRPEFQELPLELSALLAKGVGSLGEIRDLEVGSQIPLDTQVGDPAWLVAGGQAIAAGEVVEVQGRLAFRVTRLGEDHE